MSTVDIESTKQDVLRSDMSVRQKFEFFVKQDYIPPKIMNDYFEQLDPFPIDQIWGDWNGGYFYTGNRYAKLLDAPHLIWKGKRFNSYDDVQALVFDIIGHEVLPIISKAYVRMKEFKGKISVAMTYKYLPVTDHFRKVDSNTLIGVMDANIPGFDFLYFYIYR